MPKQKYVVMGIDHVVARIKITLNPPPAPSTHYELDGIKGSVKLIQGGIKGIFHSGKGGC